MFCLIAMVDVIITIDVIGTIVIIINEVIVKAIIARFQLANLREYRECYGC